MQNSSSSSNRKSATTGSFRFAQAHLRGVVVRDGPERRVSPKGAEWMEMTILVGLYDGRQKRERERPAFVRVKAFGERADLLDGIEKRDHVSVAGALVLDVWTGRDGNTRESWELYADAVSREKFPDMAELIRRNEAAAAAGRGARRLRRLGRRRRPGSRRALERRQRQRRRRPRRPERAHRGRYSVLAKSPAA